MSALLAPDERWRILQGDSLALLRDLPDGCVDLVLTDPPYSSGGFTRGDRSRPASEKYHEGGGVDFSGDNRDQRSFVLWCSLWLAECHRLVRPGGIAAVFADWRQTPSMTDALQAGGFVMRGISVMHKVNGRPNPGRPVQDCEFVIWGTAGPRHDGGYVGPRMWSGTMPNGDDRIHMTQKPVEMLKEWCMLAPPGSLILDPFAGSGSTGEAALLTGRRFLGMELTAHYAEVARNRLGAIGEHGERVSEEQPSLFEVAS